MQSRETQITMVKWTNAGGQVKRANERLFVYRPPAWRLWRNVKTTYNAEKDTTLLLFFLPKSPGGHVISFQIRPWVAFGLPYLLIGLFYIGMPLVRTDGRAVGVRSRDYQIFSDGRLPHFLSYGAPPTRCATPQNTVSDDVISCPICRIVIQVNSILFNINKKMRVAAVFLKLSITLW